MQLKVFCITSTVINYETTNGFAIPVMNLCTHNNEEI